MSSEMKKKTYDVFMISFTVYNNTGYLNNIVWWRKKAYDIILMI